MCGGVEGDALVGDVAVLDVVLITLLLLLGLNTVACFIIMPIRTIILTNNSGHWSKLDFFYYKIKKEKEYD